MMMMMMMEAPTCYETSAAGDNLCWTFSQKGSCPRGDGCRWEHRQLGQENGDNVCRAWQLWGECPRGNDCQWVHPRQQQEGMWANQQCVALPMNAQLPPGAVMIGTVQGPAEWMSYYCEGSDGIPMSPVSAQSRMTGNFEGIHMTPSNFDSSGYFEQCENVEAAQPDEDQPDGARMPTVMGEEALDVARVPEDDESSTPPKLSKIPARVQDEEHKLSGFSDDDYRNCEDESTTDDEEEARFSAARRGRRQSWPQALAVRSY